VGSHTEASVDSEKPQKLTVTAGKSTIVTSSKPAKRISVAAPEIADVTVITPQQIYITGKVPGTTNLMLWDEYGERSGAFDLEVVPDVGLLKEKLHEIFPQEDNIRVAATNSSLTLSGTVSSTANLSQILELAQAYGGEKVINFLEVGGVHQVMLEVRVSEMNRTLIKKLGIKFNFFLTNGSKAGLSLLGNIPNAADLVKDLPMQLNLAGVAWHFLGANTSWAFLVDALKEHGLVKILAEPTLITLSGKTAYFLAGGEFPVPVPQSGGTAGTTATTVTSPLVTIQYKPFGVGLNFTPTVLGSGKINMQVAPEVSELDFTNGINLSGFIVPALNTRRVSTVVELADGQSFAIAGLLNNETRQDIKKTPWLGDIPILGALFRSEDFKKDETELVIVVTVHLVKPVDIAKQTLPTDAYVEPNDFEFYLLGLYEGLYQKGGGLEGDFGHINP
jgi:pilus assembly protein CpaC